MAARITITAAPHRQGGARVAEPVVRYQGKALQVTPDLPGNLSRLVPACWGNAPAEAWRPFVVLAVAMGRL